jgi:hypothetical protein
MGLIRDIAEQELDEARKGKPVDFENIEKLAHSKALKEAK